jgi:hypothetical protein
MDAATETQNPITAGVLEGTRDACLDALLAGWPQLAAFSWESYRRLGRGAVLVTPGSIFLEMLYLAGPSCPAPDGLLESYDPDTQVVVGIALCSEHTSWIGVLSGSPTPFEAWRTVPGTVLGEAVQ